MSYERVLVALDVMSDCAATVAQRALQVVPGSRVTAVHVSGGSPYMVEIASFREFANLSERLKADAAERLEALCAPVGIENRVILEGHAANEIRRYAREQGADLVVMGAHGRRGWQSLFGSTANAVLHGRVCDILCVHIPEEVRPFREILVGVDDSEKARTVLSRAVEVACVSDARVSVVTVLRPLEYAYVGLDMSRYDQHARRMEKLAEEQARTRLDELAEEFGLSGERLVRHGHPADEMHALTDKLSVDVVVVGTHERHGLGRLVGSTANAVLHGAKSDILAVRV